MNQQTPTSLDTAARAHDAFVKSDSMFQRRARLLQALWREAEGLPVGLHREAPLGSRLAMPRAEERLENYLTPVIRDVVKAEVLDTTRSAGKLFARPRIFNDLLSSQPLCFNLFAELAENLELATRVLRRLVRTGVGEVKAIEFEWSPGRGDERYTGDKSAFDVFVRYDDEAGKPCFVGIEVKYHENLQDKAARLRPRYDEVAQSMGIFDKERLGELRAKPLQQVWRDHLLAGSMLATGEWSRGEFVFLYSRDNERCQGVVTRYAECLTDDGTFAAWTLEGVVDAIRGETDAAWVAAFYSRYLAFDRVDAAIAGTAVVESPAVKPAHVRREKRLSNLLRWSKEIQAPLRTLHEKYGHDVHLRPTSKGVTLLGLTPERPQRGKSGFRNLSRLVENFEQLFAEHCQPADHGRPTPEKALQSALIRNAYMQERVMSLLGDATKNTNDEVAPIFVADELALPTEGGRVVCDIFAVRALGGGVFRPMVIELKSKREMTRLIEQVGVYASLVEEHATAFAALAKVLLERDVQLEQKCERWIVWPEGRKGQPDRREGELAEHGIRVVTYEAVGGGFVFRAGEAP